MPELNDSKEQEQGEAICKLLHLIEAELAGSCCCDKHFRVTPAEESAKVAAEAAARSEDAVAEAATAEEAPAVWVAEKAA